MYFCKTGEESSIKDVFPNGGDGISIELQDGEVLCLTIKEAAQLSADLKLAYRTALSYLSEEVKQIEKDAK